MKILSDLPLLFPADLQVILKQRADLGRWQRDAVTKVSSKTPITACGTWRTEKFLQTDSKLSVTLMRQNVRMLEHFLGGLGDRLD